MPPLPRLRIPALADLARQLRSSRRETIRRQLARAESLGAEVDPARNYPEDWIVFRVTGYRPEMDSPATVVGAALLADLSALVERLSSAAGLNEAELAPGSHATPAELCKRWKIGRKTLDRYRRRGLVARLVMGADGKRRLLFPIEGVERFEKLSGGASAREEGFTRIAPDLEARILKRARRYHDSLGCSLNAAAKRLAAKYGRAHETIRQLLRRHDAGTKSPIFAGTGPLTARRRRAIERASRLGSEPAAIGRHFGRTRTSVHRVLSEGRAERLRSLRLGGDEQFDAKALSLEPARTGLGEPGPTDLYELIEVARRGEVALGVVERARARAYRALIARARDVIKRLPKHGTRASELDAAETDLRWAARLRAELVRSQLPLMHRTIEAAVGRPIDEVRAPVLRDLVDVCIAALGEGVDAFDAAGKGRLAAPSGLALTRAVARFLKENPLAPSRGSPGGRAAARLLPGTPIEDFTRRVAPWQTFLEPDRRVWTVLARLDADTRTLLCERFGWGGPPRTLADIASRLGTTVMHAAELERRAQRSALDEARSGDAPAADAGP